MNSPAGAGQGDVDPVIDDERDGTAFEDVGHPDRQLQELARPQSFGPELDGRHASPDSLADQADEAFLHYDPSAVNFGAWSIFANRVGDEDGNLYDGHIWISDPTGSLRAKTVGEAGYIYVEAAL